jgi:hypothetical protein
MLDLPSMINALHPESLHPEPGMTIPGCLPRSTGDCHPGSLFNPIDATSLATQQEPH